MKKSHATCPTSSRTPPCFSAAQWVLWLTPHHSVRVPAKHYCEDCMPNYQAEMLAARRCKHPETFFMRDADGFVAGQRPPTPITAALKAEPKTQIPAPKEPKK